MHKVRQYMETKVQPIINRYWTEDAFPFELLDSFKALGLGGLGYQGYDCAGGSQRLFGLVAMEMARVDASFCTFFGVHSGPSHGIDLSGRFGGAEAEMAAANGTVRENWLFWPD